MIITDIWHKFKQLIFFAFGFIPFSLFSQEINNVSAPVKFFSGNGSLFSTATDYMIFSQMLLNKGEFNGVRLLRSKTVEIMTSDHISNESIIE